ncbi:COX8A oxidase, partial [Bucco capensis]|nr:COX8A oxidase [Bucco capensis]
MPLPSSFFLRSFLRPAGRARLSRRGVISGPPQEPLGPAESVVGFLALSITCLGPAAWVLAHLEDYKKKE